MKNNRKKRISSRIHRVLFTGLYAQRIVELKNCYKRHSKHKGKDNGDE